MVASQESLERAALTNKEPRPGREKMLSMIQEPASMEQKDSEIRARYGMLALLRTTRT